MTSTLYTTADRFLREEIAQSGLYLSKDRFPTAWRRVDRAQLAAEWREVIDGVAAEVRESLPWQIQRAAETPLWPYTRSRPMPAREVRAIVRAERRFLGWLGAANQFAILRLLLAKSQSRRGENSPATALKLRAIHTQVSPGALARRVKTIRARANAILAPYGLRVSWRALAYTLSTGLGPNRRCGRAALLAAAVTATEHWYVEVRGQRGADCDYWLPATRRDAIDALILARRFYRATYRALAL